MLSRALLSLIFLISLTLQVQAHEHELKRNQVSFSVSSSEEVSNDILVAVLYAQQEGGKADSLAAAVNQAIGWGLAQARAKPEIKAQTLDYRTDPVYHSGNITGWRVRQSLRLESKDTGSLSKLIGNLQSRLKVQSIGYQISKGQRESSQERLITQSLKKFEARAAQITRDLQRPGYQLIQLNLNTGQMPPRPLMRSYAMAESAAMAPPQIEAGTGTLTVTASGTIELENAN